MTTFESLQLAEPILRAVREQGYTTPTPIQAQAIPLVLAGRDLLGGAQTGTGKTAAFVLPTLQRLSSQVGPSNRWGGRAVRALVLTPTRELAAQVDESVRTYGQHLALRSTAIFGGVGMNPQIDKLRSGVDFLVATPGRLLDLQQQGMLDLTHVEVLVLDEADRMLDMGFIHDVKKVLALLPTNKQSLLFSATFSDEIRALAQGLLHDPQTVQVTPRNSTVQRISQVIHPVARDKKKALLVHLMQLNNWSQVLVFTRTKFGANHVADYLEKNGIHAMALHGNKSQSARTQALAGFKAGDIRALVATDIAARGIDIDDLPHVVNYDIPNVCEDYVHRIGRTGRAGAEGTASNLVSLDEEGFMMAIERFTKQDIPVQAYPEFLPDAAEKAEPIAMGRQVLWGGAGKPPSRDVLAAAGKAARTEMLQRMREGKAPRAGGGGAPAGGNARGPRRGNAPAKPHPAQSEAPQATRGMRHEQPPREQQPRSHLSTIEQAVNGKGHARGFANGVVGYGAGTPRPAGNNDGQPDPMRTSVDLMARSARAERPHFVKEPRTSLPPGLPGMKSGNRPNGGGGGRRRSGPGAGGFKRP